MTDGEQYLVRWQSRDRDPTDYENALGDALEAAFADGVRELAELVERLNAIGVKAPDGTAWTEDSFRTEIKRLGA